MVCVLLLICEPTVRVLVARGHVECGLQELELPMPIFMDAFVLVAHPPAEVILQRRRKLPQVGLARALVLFECL